MHVKFKEEYSFRVSEENLITVHSDIAKILKVLHPNIYDEVLICIHELIINSIEEMNKTNQQVTKTMRF